MAKIIASEQAIADALVKAGVVTEPHNVSRVVIDIRAGHVTKVHVLQFGDERLNAALPVLLADVELIDDGPTTDHQREERG